MDLTPCYDLTSDKQLNVFLHFGGLVYLFFVGQVQARKLKGQKNAKWKCREKKKNSKLYCCKKGYIVEYDS
jgi:hypothetical protein